MQIEPPYWFPAKRYGWGWGLPMTWQGWLVLAAFMALAVAGTFLFWPRKAMAAYIMYLVVLSALLIGVCWLKGEPPRWRWGDDDGASQR
jgi:drug/metabolite transporter (DMT)-like permease